MERNTMETNLSLKHGAQKPAKAQRGIHAMEVDGALLQRIANAGRPSSDGLEAERSAEYEGS
jgi:hypothetical protein